VVTVTVVVCAGSATITKSVFSPMVSVFVLWIKTRGHEVSVNVSIVSVTVVLSISVVT